MALTSGSRLGAYEILAPLGAGGMGEVYRARDTRLKREVALKILPESFASDPERLARFQREAEVLASLNHPNIAGIYGLEESRAEAGHYVRALVMELVEGETLAERIARGAMPLDEALPIARQIAEALEAAHERGIVHRDLKPANIKVTPAGAVKVLDFGLAKLADAGPAKGNVRLQADLSMSPTITSPAMMTGAGMILGTAAYMSPEQARGRQTDRRADIWAFGCVLYEMIAGRRLFEGSDVTETLANVLKLEPAWAALPASTPAPMRRLLHRALEKDPEKRLHDIADARLELDDAVREPDAQTTSAPVRRWPVAGYAAAVAVAAALAGGVVWWVLRPAEPQVRRLAVTFDANRPLGVSNDPSFTLSPDGTSLVYLAGAQQANETSLMLRPLDRLEGTPIEGTLRAHSPAFSPDGQWVAFFSDLDGTLRKIPVAGGSPITLAPSPSPHMGLSWGPDGAIVFAGPGLRRVSANGGTPETLTTPDVAVGETFHIFPDVLPNGRGVLFTVTVNNVSRIDALRFDSGERRTVVEQADVARYAPTGHIIFFTGGRLFAAPFDQDRLETTGPPVPVVDGVAATSDGPGLFSVSRNGILLYVPGAVGETTRGTLSWIDGGKETAIGAPAAGYRSVRVSPDGSRVALEVEDAGNADIWIRDNRRGTQTRLTFTAEEERLPVWSADGTRVLFATPTALLAKRADGTGDVERLADGLARPMPSAWSRDGSVLFAMGASGLGTLLDIYVLSPGDPMPRKVIQTGGDDRQPALSPDGRWLAYQSNESGRFEIFVQPFPDVAKGRWQVSATGGASPSWSPDGRQLLYRMPSSGLRVATVTVGEGDAFTSGEPTVSFEGLSYRFTPEGRHWDMAPDGRFVSIVQSATRTDANPHIIVVENWFEELMRLVPVN